MKHVSNFFFLLVSIVMFTAIGIGQTTVTAIANGNWSAITTWSSGVVPNQTSPYENVVIPTGFVVTYSNTTTSPGQICASLDITGTLTLGSGSNNNRFLTVNGNLTVNSGGIIQPGAPTSAASPKNTILIGGNVTNNGTITGFVTNANGTGKVAFTFTKASGGATFSGIGSTSLWDMTSNLGNNSDILGLQKNITVGTTTGGTLNVTKGNITTGAFLLTLGSSGSISGEVAGNYIIGNITTTRSVGSGISMTFGSMGASLSAASEDLGNVTLTRVTGSAVSLNSNTSINRKWKLTSTNALTAARDLTVSWLSDDDNSKTLTSMQAWQSTDDFASTGNTQIIGSTTDASSRSMTVSLTSLTAGATKAFTVSQSNQPLPVELTFFTSRLKGKNVELNWSTATEVNNAGFEIERTIENGKWKIDNWNKVGFVDGSGTTNSPKNYSFTDNNLSAGKVQYRLKQIDRDGKFTYSNTVEAVVALTAEDYKLGQNFPNPFNPTTTINFAVKNTEHATVMIYNLIGQHVATLFNDVAIANQKYALTFDAKNLPSGIYFYSFRSASRNEVKKMLLTK